MGSGGAYDVFLSYAHSDGAAAAELNGWLSGHGLSTFFDRNALRPGLRWIPALEDAIGRSKAVAILLGPHGVGNTQQYERELALVPTPKHSNGVSRLGGVNPLRSSDRTAQARALVHDAGHAHPGKGSVPWR